jgi:hypothetical protein
MIKSIKHSINVSYLPGDYDDNHRPPDPIELLDRKLNEIEQGGGRIIALNQTDHTGSTTTTYLITFRLPPSNPYRDYPHGEIEHEDA